MKQKNSKRRKIRRLRKSGIAKVLRTPGMFPHRSIPNKKKNLPPIEE